MIKLTVASYNIHKCIGLDKKFDPSRIVDVICQINPDILALQEVDKRFGKKSGLLELSLFKKKLGLIPVPIKPNCPDSHGWHGNLILYRNAMPLSFNQINLPGAEPRGALDIFFEFKNNKKLRFISTHLGLLKYSRKQQIECLISLIKEKPKIPTLLCGDLNEWRLGKRSSLENLEQYLGKPETILSSFPADFPVFPLDRFYSFPSNILSSIDIHETLISKIASDHLPIKARLDF